MLRKIRKWLEFMKFDIVIALATQVAALTQKLDTLTSLAVVATTSCASCGMGHTSTDCPSHLALQQLLSKLILWEMRGKEKENPTVMYITKDGGIIKISHGGTKDSRSQLPYQDFSKHHQFLRVFQSWRTFWQILFNRSILDFRI